MTYLLLSALTGLIFFFTLGHTQPDTDTTVDNRLSKAKSVSGEYISWREHIIDDPISAQVPFNGSDGLVLADLDLDGFLDIISVHESDSGYDSSRYEPSLKVPLEGHVRIAFGSADPDEWLNITLAEGPDVAAPEDAAVGDVNGDGYPDIIVAAELAHLIYLQNPGKKVRSQSWQRLILPMTQNVGSFLRVFLADFDGDGKLEATTANKGAQRPGPGDYARSTPISLLRINGDPLKPNSWQMIELGNYSVPQNAEPIDLDQDGDMDIIIGSRGEQRIAWFENLGRNDLSFTEHAIGVIGAQVSGFNMSYADINQDGRLDILIASRQKLYWLQQPPDINDGWLAHKIGTFAPDTVTGLIATDINSDGHLDVMAGSYSAGDRSDESDYKINDPLGRLGWFENPGAGNESWVRHDISRRKRGMFDKFIAQDMDGDGDIDFIGTRGNSGQFDGVFWLEQVRSALPKSAFLAARAKESQSMALPQTPKM